MSQSSTLTGGRLLGVSKYLDPKQDFLVAYGDGLANVDIDNDPTSIVKSVFANDNPGLVTATIVNNQLTLDYQDNQSGTANLTIRGTSNGKTVDNTFLVTVNPVDDAPTVINPITDVNVNEDAANTVIDLTNIFTDIDNEPTSIVKSVFVNNNPGLVTATIVDNQLTLDYQNNITMMLGNG